MKENASEEVPETPAHLFALRAFKTAIFGTPAIGQDEAIIEDPITNMLEDAQPGLKIELPKNIPSLGNVVKSASSPMKSILLTPGTIAPHRKTVTFSAVRDDAGLAGQDGKTNTRQLTRRPSFDDLTQPRDALRKSLFQPLSTPQDWHLGKDKSGNAANSVSPAKLPAEKGSKLPQLSMPALEPETTIDLTSPKSRSGRHWKGEYQREHEKTKAEMKRLIRYSQTTKSFAAKRDGVATRLREKLDEAEAKVQQLEQNVTQLASELRRVPVEATNHARLMEELAIQTTNAVRYKQKAEQYRASLQNNSRPAADEPDFGDQRGWRTQGTQTRDATTLEQPEDDEAASRMMQLEQENLALRKTIARVKDEMQRYEERHHSWKDSRRRRDERWAAKRKELEDELAQIRAENQRLQAELQARKTQVKPVEATTTHSSHVQPTKIRSNPEGEVPSEPIMSKRQHVSSAQPRAVAEEPRQTSQSRRGQPKPKETLLAGPESAASLRERHRSLNLPRITHGTPSADQAPHDETLDLWELAASLEHVKPKASARTASFKPRGTKTLRASATADAFPPTGEALWDNLKRRTSLSMMSNQRGSPVGGIGPVRPGNVQGWQEDKSRPLGGVGKENTRPAASEEHSE